MMEQFTFFLVPSDGISTHLKQVPKSQLDKGSKLTVLTDFNDESAFVDQPEDTIYLEERQDDDGHRRLVLAIKVLLMSIDNTISLFVNSFFIYYLNFVIHIKFKVLSNIKASRT